MIERSVILKNQRFAGQVKRYHTWPTLQSQTNADHTWHVMRIYVQLFAGYIAGPHEAALGYIMYHDIGEIKTGDLPFPVKSENPFLKDTFDNLEDGARVGMGIYRMPAIDPNTKMRIKLCDLLEMWEFGQQEYAMGNTYAGPIIEDTGSMISKLAADMDAGGILMARILKHMGDFPKWNR